MMGSKVCNDFTALPLMVFDPPVKKGSQILSPAVRNVSKHMDEMAQLFNFD